MNKFFSVNLNLIKKQLKPTIIVHGGCGEYSDEKVNKKLIGCKIAASLGYKSLQKTGSVLDAVENTIRYLEDNPNFNCGYGSVLNDLGEVEMDASIVDGKDLSYGGVFVIKDVAHPITLARLIMEKSSYCVLTGKGALKFAKNNGVSVLKPGALVSPQAKQLLEKSTQFGATEAGTVGCCAMDIHGNLAAGTSTGGLNKKLRGRCGDTAAAGAGTYADNSVGAVSSTGHGESCVKVCLTCNILNEISKGVPPKQAASMCLKNIQRRFKQTAGVIILTKTGDIAAAVTASRMVWVAIKDGKVFYGTKTGEVLVD
ncbi:isoaspartyl peptidase/L-asparaginase-like [Onthophagus taurus]|uniref:isoaspartyl peptidase/L-asparaginase-like n=1 Tax=Onthophagus taurus TaxID=166361 RepID=UPI000C20B454|nr:isoaspartyl peptidase/L-asparaginase-like [Onthophagus taurus]